MTDDARMQDCKACVGFFVQMNTRTKGDDVGYRRKSDSND